MWPNRMLFYAIYKVYYTIYCRLLRLVTPFQDFENVDLKILYNNIIKKITNRIA